MSKIIVGVDESPGSADAIALASSLAGMTGATLMLVNVFPYDPHPSRAVNADFENFLREDSEALLEGLRSAHGDDTAQVKAIAETSPPRALHELAEREDAGLIVVGSTHTGRAGRVMPGSTAERLLHGSPCPVAVAPSDYAHRTLGEPGIVGCGYDGTPAADGALAVAHRLAAATGARLRVIRAFHPVATVPQRGVAMGHAREAWFIGLIPGVLIGGGLAAVWWSDAHPDSVRKDRTRSVAILLGVGIVLIGAALVYASRP